MKKTLEELFSAIDGETGNSIMHDLYYGHIIPWEHKATRLDEQKELSRKIEIEERYFEDILPPNDYERFQKFIKLYDDISSFTELDAFTYGFRLAVRFMVDVYTNTLDKPVRGGQS